MWSQYAGPKHNRQVFPCYSGALFARCMIHVCFAGSNFCDVDQANLQPASSRDTVTRRFQNFGDSIAQVNCSSVQYLRPSVSETRGHSLVVQSSTTKLCVALVMLISQLRRTEAVTTKFRRKSSELQFCQSPISSFSFLLAQCNDWRNQSIAHALHKSWAFSRNWHHLPGSCFALV